MRVPGGWNTLIVIFLLFVLLLLNYFNVVALSKTFPLLSFLPHSSKTEISQQIATPTPQPLPPITVKRVDPVKGTGEFVINNPTPQADKLSLEKQIVIDGVYDVNNKKVTIQTSVQDSTIPIHQQTPVFFDSPVISLILEMLSKDKLIYQTNIQMFNEENTNTLSFSVRLPFYNDVTIKIYDSSGKELLSQQTKL